MRIKLVDYLTDNYSKHPESNNAKLLGLVDAELNELAEVFTAIEASRDIDNAYGATLDKAGKNVLEYRNSKDDELYRDHIKVKIKANLSKGDIPTLNEIAEFLLGDSLIGIKEAWNSDAYSNEPAGLIVHMHPTFRTIPSVLNRAVSGGVRLWWQVDMRDDIFNLITHPRSWHFDYPLTNKVVMATKPGKSLPSSLQMHSSNRTWKFGYPLTNTFCPRGARGTITKSKVEMQAQPRAFLFNYPLCGTFAAGEVSA